MRYDAQVSHRAPVLVMETVLQISSKYFFIFDFKGSIYQYGSLCILMCFAVSLIRTSTNNFLRLLIIFFLFTEPPTVALRPSHHEVKAGTTMFLNLAAEGTPPPVFQWYRNGYLVPGLTGKK